MKIKHNSASGKTTITMNWLETRQFINMKNVREHVRNGLHKLVNDLSPLTTDKVKGSVEVAEVG